jgi:hypothetical protein
VGVQTRRWTNQSQPQTLVIATFLLYFGAVFIVLGNGPGIGLAIAGNGSLSAIDTAQTIENFARLFIAVGGVYAGYQIANEKKLGWYIGIAVAALPLLAKLLAMVRFHIGLFDFDLVNLMFEIALLALILHNHSRNYVRIWFK